MTIQNNRTKFGYLFTNRFIKRAGALLLAAVLIAQPFGQFVSALQVLDYNNVPFTSAEVATNWAKDRTLPSGGYGSVGFGGRTDVLEMNIAKSKQASGAFYHTEGLQRSIPASVSLKADVYVDSDWTSNGKTVRAGLWGVGYDAASQVSSYPIVEFTTDGFTGWRTYDSNTGLWTNAGAATIGWNTLEITQNQNSHEIDYRVNGQVVGSYDDAGTTSFKAAILNSKNYATADYSAHWSNFAYGSYSFVAETPTNAKFNNPTVCGGATNQLNTVATWNPVVGAASYTYKSWKDGHATYKSFDSAYTVNVNGTSQPGAFNIGEGTYYFAVQAVYANGEKSGWSTPCAATYDTTAPVAKVTVPAKDGKVVRGSVAVTGQAVDANMKSHWFEITGPNNYVTYRSNMNTTDSAYSFNWDTAGLTSGTYKIRYVATDKAGNRSDSPNYSNPTIRTVIVDNTAPVGAIAAPINGTTIKSVDGKIVVSGTVSDNQLMNRVGVQLVKPGVSGDIKYLIDHMVNQNPGVWEVEFDAAVLNLANGTYGINVYFVDMVGNVTTKKMTFTLNNPAPTVNTEDFGVGSWTLATHKFTGFNVGFNIHDFKTVSSMTVDLYNEDDKIDTNTASSALLTMVNAGDSKVLPSLSTPFVTQGNLIDDWCNGSACWNMGGYEWEAKDKIPVKAVITVVGTDVYGKAVTKTVENNEFSEVAGVYTTILPHLIFLPAPVGQTPAANNVGGNNEQAATVRNVTPTIRVGAPAEPEVVVVEDDQQGEVLGASTDKTAVLAATDTAADEEEQPQAANKGVANWVWWTSGGGAALTGAWWALAGLRRRGE